MDVDCVKCRPCLNTDSLISQFNNVSLKEPIFFRYVNEDFDKLAQEYLRILSAINNNQFHLIFDPKPNPILITNYQANREIIEYLGTNGNGFSLLASKIPESLRQDWTTIETLVEYYISSISI